MEALLQEKQLQHLKLVESWAEHMPTVMGVPLCKALSYELVQVLNVLAVKELTHEMPSQ